MTVTSVGGPATELKAAGVTLVRNVDAAIQSLEGLLDNEERKHIRQRDKAVLSLLEAQEGPILSYLRSELKVPTRLFPAGTVIDAISFDKVTPTKPLVYEDSGGKVRFAFAARVETTYAGRVAQSLERSEIPVLEGRDNVLQQSAVQSAILPDGLMTVPAETVASVAHLLVRLDAEAERKGDGEYSDLTFAGADVIMRVDNLRVLHELVDPGQA